MLEGLEARSVGISKAETNKDFRVDSDFWTREPKRNPALNYAPIGSVLESAQYGISIEMNEDGVGVPIYRMNEIHNMLCDFDVSKSADIGPDDVKKFKLNDRDVLFNRTNSYEWVGRTGLFREQGDNNFVFASYLVRLVPNEKVISPEYLVAFLNCKYGIWDIRRRSRQSINQTNVNPEEVKEIEIPLLGDGVQRLIKQCFDHGAEGIQKSKTLMATAESTLIKALALDNWTPPNPLSYVRSSGDAFTAGRFDAEYFHPAKTTALSILDKVSDARVGDFFDSVRELWQPSKSKGAAVRNHDLTDALEPFLDSTKAPTLVEEIRSTKKLVQPGDLVVSRLRSYLREIAVVLPGDGTTTVVSTEYIVLRPKKSSALAIEALLIYLRSQLPQIVFKWSQDGSNHPRFDENELLNIPIPRTLISNQMNYVKAMQEMITQRQLAVSLLDAAKRAVEIAIEDSEAAALAYLQGVV